MFATVNTRATDDLAVRGRGFKVEAETEVYILLSLIGPKCDPALGHGHHTTGRTSPAYGKGTFHLYLGNQMARAAQASPVSSLAVLGTRVRGTQPSFWSWF